MGSRKPKSFPSWEEVQCRRFRRQSGWRCRPLLFERIHLARLRLVLSLNRNTSWLCFITTVDMTLNPMCVGCNHYMTQSETETTYPSKPSAYIALDSTVLASCPSSNICKGRRHRSAKQLQQVRHRACSKKKPAGLASIALARFSRKGKEKCHTGWNYGWEVFIHRYFEEQRSNKFQGKTVLLYLRLHEVAQNTLPAFGDPPTYSNYQSKFL